MLSLPLRQNHFLSQVWLGHQDGRRRRQAFMAVTAKEDIGCEGSEGEQ